MPFRLREDDPHEQLFRAVADSTYDWESWIAPDGHTVWVNPAVERLTGYTVGECMAMRDYPLPMVHPEDRARVSEVLREALAGSSGNDLEFRIIGKDGATRWVAISWQRIDARDGRPLGYRSSVRDIHERKRFESRLREAHEIAERAARAKSDFLAHLSHELRTPLQAIAGFSELLAGTGLDATQRRYVSTIADQTRVVLRQMEDLLQYAALDAAPPVLEVRAFELAPLCRRAVDALAPLAATKGLSLRCDVARNVPRWVLGDATRIAQVLGNLLGNAVKFTDRGSVTLRVAKTGEQVAFVVSDTGVGIPEHDLARVLEPFVQGRVGRHAGGVGLGLAIVHRLVLAMEGRVAIESEPGIGTKVGVTLPLRATSRPGEPVREGDEPIDTRFAAAHPLAILVVDDSPPGRELAIELLRSFGYEPTAAENGHAAVALARARAFDLVIMDYQMPDLDGVSATQLLRAEQRPGQKPPYVALLTANVFADPRTHSPYNGVDIVLTKPIARDRLRALLERIATGRAARPAPARRSARSRSAGPLDPRVLDDLRATPTADGGTMLAKIGGRVLAEVPGLVTRLRAPELDGPTVAALAHRIKGDCLVVGARRAAQAAEALHALAADGAGRPAIVAGIATLGEAWEATVPALRRAMR